MLYVGRNADVSLKARLDASEATCSNGTNGDHSTTAYPTGSRPRRPARRPGGAARPRGGGARRRAEGEGDRGQRTLVGRARAGPHGARREEPPARATA